MVSQSSGVSVFAQIITTRKFEIENQMLSAKVEHSLTRFYMIMLIKRCVHALMSRQRGSDTVLRGFLDIPPILFFSYLFVRPANSDLFHILFNEKSNARPSQYPHIYPLRFDQMVWVPPVRPNA